eukprot:TRINITY_DN3732_c0_g3_i1.p1 TRINITY_DN3732_c0_g3~~TRINITY_DN3732_c0_g3_i1.p1  ORF type:complete len:394 (-),score=103.65 TRINITY_DN3732_c0_g3_i1:232-1305(-)
MGVNHSVNHRQMELVLTQFEATTEAIRGIEEKVARVNDHVSQVQKQHMYMYSQMDKATKVLHKLTHHGGSVGHNFVEQLTGGIECAAGMVNQVETHMSKQEFDRLPQVIRTQVSPLALPAALLVLTITTSNIVFGFLLAGDENLSAVFSFRTIKVFKGDGSGSKVAVGQEDVSDDFDVVKWFAIFHAILIGIVALYFVIEQCALRCCRSRQEESEEEEEEEQAGEEEAEETQLGLAARGEVDDSDALAPEACSPGMEDSQRGSHPNAHTSSALPGLASSSAPNSPTRDRSLPSPRSVSSPRKKGAKRLMDGGASKTLERVADHLRNAANEVIPANGGPKRSFLNFSRLRMRSSTNLQ